jgi:hypothetical protein
LRGIESAFSKSISMLWFATNRSVRRQLELEVVGDFATDVPEAQRILEDARHTLLQTPAARRPNPEDRDRAEKEVRREAKLKDLTGQELTLRRLREEADARANTHAELGSVPAAALNEFAEFLVSPGVRAQLKRIEQPSKELKEILEANAPAEIAECIQTLSAKTRQELAKALKLTLGKKQVKKIALSSFRPSIDIVWSQDDLDLMVKEFDMFLRAQWDEGSYLKIE